jgi:hypothetical protein
VSNWELIDYNRDTGLRKYIGDHPDDPTGVLVRYEQDARSIGAVLDRNKEAANHYSIGRMSDNEKVAEIPVGVMYEWLVKHGVNAWNPAHRDGVKRLLNSSDYRYLKCRDIII